MAAAEVARSMPAAATARDLATALYRRWYLGLDDGGDDGAAPAMAVGVPTAADVNLLDALRSAHVDSGRWLDGWSVRAVSSRGRALVERHGRERVLHRVDVLAGSRPCLPPRAGDRVRVTARRDYLDEEGGFWFAAGGAWDEAVVPPSLVRLYWHVSRAGAPALVHHLTRALDGGAVPHSLKVARADPPTDRPDGAVLYVEEAHVEAALAAAAACHPAVSPWLRPGVPRLTLELAPGVGLAEDPGTGESFGQARCRVVAAAVADRRDASLDEAAAGALAALETAGVDPGRPHLRPGSDRDYRWPPP
ncbi:MAG TPA: T3SS effector HopA1 family protein [Acidimicrobiales bacterium]|nr:T3SS effector HopA1 family protein [Acidimicrobiales bacterium]